MATAEHPAVEFVPLKHGQFCWTEIASNDAEKCMEFYTNVFGWTFKKSEAGDGMAYNEYSTGAGHPSGGLYNIDPKWFGDEPPPPHFMTYIATDDVDTVTQRAGELGATIIREPMDIPGVGRMSVIKDPTGAVFATFKSKM